ncbi:MAG TPA: type II secretion system protein [Rhodocyclaceae bacterium]|nr:type II secretion system protein [Rhodocyclaceae bacterium]
MSISKGLRRQSGVTLVEQIVFIIVVSVGVIGVLSTLGPSLKFSADPQLRKQQLAIAESLLAEILHQPFTYCDPDDLNAMSATSSASCSAGMDQDNGGSPNPLTTIPAGMEARLSSTAPFDNVADYALYTQTGVTGLSSAAVNGYTATVAVSRAGAMFAGLSDSAALKIDVTVTGNGADPLTLTGYRFRYAPRY